MVVASPLEKIQPSEEKSRPLFLVTMAESSSNSEAELSPQRGAAATDTTTTKKRTRTRGFTRIIWSVAEKELIYTCFAYSRSERWNRNKNLVFEEQLRKSSLNPEKLEQVTTPKLTSLMSQISKYIRPERLSELKDLSLKKAEIDFLNETEPERCKRKTGWGLEENWTLLWATEYARTLHNNKTRGYTNLWRSIMERYCPTRSDHKSSNAQLYNVKKSGAFSDHMTYLAEKVKLHIEQKIDPLTTPIPMPKAALRQVSFRTHTSAPQPTLPALNLTPSLTVSTPPPTSHTP